MEYIKCRRFYALLLLVLDGLFTLMFWLTQADGSAPMYIFAAVHGTGACRRGDRPAAFRAAPPRYSGALGRIFAAADGLPEPDSLIEADYQELVRAVCADSARARAGERPEDAGYARLLHALGAPDKNAHRRDAADPAVGRRPNSAELEQELFRVEQYVEMVLNYLRLGAIRPTM